MMKNFKRPSKYVLLSFFSFSFSLYFHIEYAMANVVCEYADESPTRPTSSHMEDHPDYSGRSMSPPAKRFVSENSYYSGMSEPGRRIRRSESLLRQAADNVSKGQTFQTVSDMFQIPISTIR